VLIQLKPNSKEPLKFEKNTRILDIAASQDTMIALTTEQQVYVWGRRMGIYPQIELTLDCVEKKGWEYSNLEINQSRPRLAKNNLVFYKIQRVFAGFNNFGLETAKGEILLQGCNENH